MQSITPRIGYGLRHPALARVDALNARLASLKSPAFRFAPQIDEPRGEIYGADGLPELSSAVLEMAPPPQTVETPSFTTPAPLEAIELAAREWDDVQEQRAEMLDYLGELRAERQVLRAELAELEKVCNPPIYGVDDNPDTSKIKARLGDLDELLVFDDEPENQLAARPWSGIVFRGSAYCNGGIIIGHIECNASGDFETMRAGRAFRRAAILPFWGPLPTCNLRRACDGHRKQAACAILETVLGADPATAPDSLHEAQRLFRPFAATFLAALPVQACFTGADVWAWLDSQNN